MIAVDRTLTEQNRLSALNDCVNKDSIRALNLERGLRVLDVGCGLGQLTRAMARQTGPSGSVLGIERSSD